MMTERTQRAYRSNIRSAILEVLRETADRYAEQGDPDSDMRDAPEYFINVNLAQGLADRFSSLRFRLEHQASSYGEAASLDVNAKEAIGKQSARFDIVLLNKANNVPRYIIEVKRGTKILGDAKRILSMAALDSGRRRWRHGFLVTTLRRTKEDAEQVVARLAEEVSALRQTVNAQLAVHQAVTVTSLCERIGNSRSEAVNKSIYGAVFHIALLDKRLPESGDNTLTPEPGMEFR